MENATKKTKTMYFEELRELVLTTVIDAEKQAEYVEFIDKQIEALDKRKAAAAARAEKKKAESDALTDAIYELIGDKLVTVDEITVAFDDEEVTRAKITARLGKLVNAGLIEKEPVRVDGKKRMAYRRISTAVEE